MITPANARPRDWNVKDGHSPITSQGTANISLGLVDLQGTPGLHPHLERATNRGYSHVDSYVDTVSKLSYMCVCVWVLLVGSATPLASVLAIAQVGGTPSLVPRPSPAPVFDHLQYAKTEGEGLVNLTT